MSSPSPYSSKDAWAAGVSNVFNCPDSELEARILTLYSKEATITVNGKAMNWDSFYPYVENIRATRVSVEIKSHYFLRDGNMFAEKHTAIGIGKDGSTTQVEAIVIGELNENGKAIWLEESARFV